MPDFAQLILHGAGLSAAGRWELPAGATTIGRDEDCDIVLADREVSRRHAQIRNESGSYILVDLGSTNGTLVNGVRVERSIPLRSGDEITIVPRHRLQFLDSDATLPVSAGRRGLSVDRATRTVTVDDQPVDPPLAPIQFALLSLLAEHPLRVFTRDEIADACYPEAAGGVSDQAIDGVVRRLRARLAEHDPATEYIAAVRGHGYRLQG
jgi:DNA-binding response OmpR family regulator